MSHLPAERLAALADHSHCPDLAPTMAERAHLDACPACAREVNAYGRLIAASNDARFRDAEPLAPWAGIAAALRSEGLIAGEPAHGTRDAGRGVALYGPGESRVASHESDGLDARRSALGTRWAGRAAAALMFVAAGAAAGRATAGSARPATGPASADTLSSVASAVGSAVGTGTLQAVSYAVDTATRFASTAEALSALTSAERQYEHAAAFLVEHDSSSHPADSSQLYKARLAALDNVMAATREALYDAPHDPLINRYYLATMGAREATLRQLGSKLPQGERISRY